MKTKRQKKDAHLQSLAPGQTLGYSLQYTLLTHLLLTAKEGSYCSLEVLDDVAVETPDGGKRLMQSKSALGGNPVSDRAIGLWKSLFNWVQAVQSGYADPSKTVFELYVSTLKKGDIVNKFSEALTDEQAREAISYARNSLWGAAPIYPLRSELASDLALFVNPVLECEDTVLIPLIVHFRLTTGSGSPQADLESLVRSIMPVSPSKVADILNHVCGWVKRNVDLLLEAKRPAIISHDDFHREFTAFTRKIDRDLILQSVAPRPTKEEAVGHMPRIFVQQLNLIDMTYEEKLEGISDYLRACYDRAVWSKRGDVHESSFDDLDASLKRTWANVKRRTEVQLRTAPEVDQGRALYSDCMEQKTSVQGMEPPNHFVPGCFHRLADEQEVGWHPRYRDRLAAKATTEGGSA